MLQNIRYPSAEMKSTIFNYNAIVSQKQNNVPGPENTNPIIHFQITWMLEPTENPSDDFQSVTENLGLRHVISL